METYKEVSITKIRPDPQQPRRSFNDELIEEMAQSIRTAGIINAIEVDPDYIIITGEQRWRAAKKAGLTVVPVKILNIDKSERFMRQVIENVQHNTMSDWDTAKAFERLLTMPRSGHVRAPITGPSADKGIRWLSKTIGVPRSVIAERLSLLRASPRFLSAIKRNKVDKTNLRVLERAPQEFKKILEKKLLANEFKTTDAGLEVAGALKRNPEQANKILSIDYSKYPRSEDVTKVLSKISPRITDKIIAAIKPTDELASIVNSLLKWLDVHTPDTVGKHNLHRVVVNLQTADKEITKWLKR